MSKEFYESKERRVLLAMRKTLSKIIRDLTPTDSTIEYPLKTGTVEDIKACLSLISVREKELADQAGIRTAQPHFIDEPQPSTDNVVSLNSLRKK
jgi:hypothetical protein